MNSLRNFSIVSATLSALFLALAGFTSVLAITVPSLIFGFILVPCFISMLACLHHYCPPERKVFSLLGLVFAIHYGCLISFNYILQLSLAQQPISGGEFFSITNPNSMFFVIEMLGYFFLGLATIVVLPVFGKSRLERVIQSLFLLNGILGIGGLIGFIWQLDMRILLAGLLVWNVIMPVAAGLMVFYFRKQPT